MSYEFSKVEYINALIKEFAQKYELYFCEPQNNTFVL